VQGKLEFLRSVCHKNFVPVVKTFHNEDWDEIESIVEFMPVEVVDLCVRGFPFLKQLSLAAILGQASCDLSTNDSATAKEILGTPRYIIP
jgi:hypothetical protein